MDRYFYLFNYLYHESVPAVEHNDYIFEIGIWEMKAVIVLGLGSIQFLLIRLRRLNTSIQTPQAKYAFLGSRNRNVDF